MGASGGRTVSMSTMVVTRVATRVATVCLHASHATRTSIALRLSMSLLANHSRVRTP